MEEKLPENQRVLLSALEKTMAGYSLRESEPSKYLLDELSRKVFLDNDGKPALIIDYDWIKQYFRKRDPLLKEIKKYFEISGSETMNAVRKFSDLIESETDLHIERRPHSRVERIVHLLRYAPKSYIISNSIPHIVIDLVNTHTNISFKPDNFSLEFGITSLLVCIAINLVLNRSLALVIKEEPIDLDGDKREKIILPPRPTGQKILETIYA